jgi:RimJ/RimL family protein N-acetyltransferase
MKVEPVILEGKKVRLEPLSLEHIDALTAVGIDPELWRWTNNICSNRDDMRKYVEIALADQRAGVALPFVTIDRESGTVIGSTRFGNIEIQHRKAEIGWTWINPEWQRTYVNTEAKFLMFQHAFEVWDAVRVDLKTDVLNERSRKAILRIGAKEEGIHRNHMITDGGRRRDSIYFSVIDTEWPEVKKRLTAFLNRQADDVRLS